MKFDLSILKESLSKLYSSISDYDGEDKAHAKVEVSISEGGDVDKGTMIDCMVLTVTTKRPATDYKSEAEITRTMEIFSDAENRPPTLVTTTKEKIKLK